ncbi:MAG: 1,4-dihydroxy-2-naphthoate octaprenyltransferase [Gammaproteobacteria bacterium]|nr:MAG: 1,4-dihydroxy-2-naphthoate octaprenyltransferase [Gammaproteobacteria bacterium]
MGSVEGLAVPAGEPTAAWAQQHPVASHVLATRPPFLLASVAPVLIGMAAATHAGVAIQPLLAILTVLAVVLLHATVNVFNDYYDHRNGGDAANTARVFPFTGGSRFIQNGVFTDRHMLLWALLLCAAVMVVGIVILVQLPPVARPGLVLLGITGLLVGWAYSAPPLRLNSRGLGEVSVAVGFGALMPLGADYVQGHDWSALPVYAGLPYGLLVTNLLWINQFPDHAADALVGKRHGVVRLGIARARMVYVLCAALAYAGLAGMVMAGLLPLACLAGLLVLPLSAFAARQLWRYATQPACLVPAIRATIVAMLLHAMLVSAGLCWAS